MNIVFLNKQFDTLTKKESAIKFQFEPQMEKLNPGWKRHIYFNELKYDFMCEISAYGFSPYIHQTFDSQRKNKRIMMYNSQKFNYNLVEYIRKQNEKETTQLTSALKHKAIRQNKKMLSRDDIKTSSKSSIIKTTSTKNILNCSAVLPHQDFLSNALRKIAMSTPKSKASLVNKSIRITNEGNTTLNANAIVNMNPNSSVNTNINRTISITNEKKIIKQKKKEFQVKTMEHLKEKYLKSLRQFRNMHPAVKSMDLNDSNTRMNFTLLRKYAPEFDKTVNPVGLIKNQQNPAAFAKREREREKQKEIERAKELKTKDKQHQESNTFKKLQPSFDPLNKHPKKRMAKSAHCVNKDNNNLLHRARKSSEIIFHYV